MYWLKVIFFTIILIRQLETFQNETSLADSKSTSGEILEITACGVGKIEVIGCRNENNYTFSFSENDSTNSWDISAADCCAVCIFNNTLIINSLCLDSSCFPNVSVVAGNISYFLKASHLNKIRAECPKQSQLCVDHESEEKDISCLFKNVSVTSMLEREHSYIYLNITWNPIGEDENVYIFIQPSEDTTCRFNTIHIHNMSENQVILPALGALPESRIKPNCKLIIHFLYSIGECKFQYEVPECVEDMCACVTHHPTPRISKLELISQDEFIIYWDPGTTTPNNKTYYIKTVYFYYKPWTNRLMEIEAYDIKEPDFNKNKATVSIELSENENYTLYGYFINNFHCGKIALFEFEAPLH